MEDYEMLKALYDFQAAHAKTMSFNEGEYFLLYQTSAKQRNWWPVVNMKGQIGFVPSNYVVKLKVEPNFLVAFLNSSIDSLKQCENENINGIIKKNELLQRLNEKKQAIEQLLEYKNSDDEFDGNQNGQCNDESSEKNENEETSIESQILQENSSKENLNMQIGIKSTMYSHPEISDPEITTKCKTPDIQQNNFTNEESHHQENNYKENCVVEDENKLENGNANNENPSINISITSKNVYQVVDAIRKNTNLSFDYSCEALRVVLNNLEQLFPNSVHPYLDAVAMHLNEKIETPKELLGITHDAKRLQYIFSQLTDCKNDSEQRSWMLYEDEEDIVQFLEELLDILKNADENVSCHEMSCDHYQSLINLVQYYQMESRCRIKSLLLKVFTAACHLDHIVVDILLTSTLPLEIAQDIQNKSLNLEEFKELIKMLTVIFSLGQTMPVNHQEQLNAQFITFLLEVIEQNHSDSLIDLIIAFILAFNLQFNNITQNIVLDAIRNLISAKIFTQKILLLLNREEDPAKILKHSVTHANSVLKMVGDLFSYPEIANLFYTNDCKVLIDILIRQLSDLSTGDPSRKQYLELCRKILRNTNYVEHTHRKQDLIKIFTRIFCEETECSADDQQLVRDIANEFPHIFKA